MFFVRGGVVNEPLTPVMLPASNEQAVALIAAQEIVAVRPYSMVVCKVVTVNSGSGSIGSLHA